VGGGDARVLALLFDFMNGFHDAANSIATVVSTGVLRPTQAVAFAAFFNVIAIFVSSSSRWRPRWARASSTPPSWIST
jgi:phosphate/sulfate permease